MTKKIEGILRLAVSGEFLGHGALALQGKAQWVVWISRVTGLGAADAALVLTVIGLLDVVVVLIILFRPIKVVVLWTTFWGFFTAIVRPFLGESIWDFVERFANFGAPLALYYILSYRTKEKSGQSSRDTSCQIAKSIGGK